MAGDAVADALSRLTTEWDVTPSELDEACRYYAAHGWIYPDAWNAASEVAQGTSLSSAARRTTDVIAHVAVVAEEIAVPKDWAMSVYESIGKPLEDWTETDHATYEGIIDARVGELVEPLCAQ